MIMLTFAYTYLLVEVLKVDTIYLELNPLTGHYLSEVTGMTITP